MVDAEEDRIGQWEQALKCALHCAQARKAVGVIGAQPRLGVVAEQLHGGLRGARQKRTPRAPDAHVELHRPDVIQATELDKHPSLLRRERRLLRCRGPKSEGTDQRLQIADAQPPSSLDLLRGHGPLGHRRHQHRVEDRTLGIATLDRTLDHLRRDPNRAQSTSNITLRRRWI